ncbi:hypothetical protein DFH27DRAFT_625063 [Peziza echinospora]|nr:hypothetical protein DFH27DRAFT_625063 [Peziza echinospora]
MATPKEMMKLNASPDQASEAGDFDGRLGDDGKKREEARMGRGSVLGREGTGYAGRRWGRFGARYQASSPARYLLACPKGRGPHTERRALPYDENTTLVLRTHPASTPLSPLSPPPPLLGTRYTRPIQPELPRNRAKPGHSASACSSAIGRKRRGSPDGAVRTISKDSAEKGIVFARGPSPMPRSALLGSGGQKASNSYSSTSSPCAAPKPFTAPLCCTPARPHRAVRDHSPITNIPRSPHYACTINKRHRLLVAVEKEDREPFAVIHNASQIPSKDYPGGYGKNKKLHRVGQLDTPRQVCYLANKYLHNAKSVLYEPIITSSVLWQAPHQYSHHIDSTVIGDGTAPKPRANPTHAPRMPHARLIPSCAQIPTTANLKLQTQVPSWWHIYWCS